MKNKIKFISLATVAFSLVITACTDLVTKELDSTIASPSAIDPGAFLTSAYQDLGQFADQANLYALTEHTTDELIPPTRGTDWDDNGVWRSLYSQTWDESHSQIYTTFKNLNANQYKATQILGSNPTTSQAAEAKFLRAFNMSYLIDFYGQVPFREVTDAPTSNPKVLSRSEAFELAIKDLTEALSGLTSIGPNPLNTKASKAAANALLARLYLNKAVYKAGTPSGPYTFDKADMDKVIQYCDAVKADGFDLEQNYFNNFTLNASSEIILTVGLNSGTPKNRIWMTTHYDQNPSGWNGFTTLADFYGKFEAKDGRLSAPSPAPKGAKYYGINRGFLFGQQYDDQGNPIIDSRSKKPLSFSKDVPLNGAATEKGIRVIKYHPVDFDAGTQYILMRYADVYLMKAEAIYRGGTSSSTTALQLVNDLRAKRGASPLTSLDANTLLDERGRELYWEGYRRNDLIRFGKYNSTWSEKTNTEAFRVLFPIPALELAANPNLKQNAGY